MSSSHPSNAQLTIAPDMITSTPVKLEVKQKYWSWFKQTGRGFSITKDDGSVLFVVGSSSMGKHRIIEDAHGKPLFSLERNWTSQKRAWVLKSEEDVVLTVEFSWFQRKLSMEATPSDGTKGKVNVDANDMAGGNLRITSGEETMATIQCEGAMTGYLSWLKVTPPVWSVDVAAGADLCLVTVLAVCASDAFSENRRLML
ncbi:uncharacterized protein LTR77_006223 [Saxophila tyrrhenica]|uniref:Uncharacterized protein n=1 Tax=Saxophila tyrrhenica TaxID=1690608 RepID=A0AAV9P774_9PEZI|nr:hypothetical protein LTR77_006223 [Saxophila tyrrhenica]